MISKEQFVKYAKRVDRNEKALSDFESLFGGGDVRDNSDLFITINHAGEIAMYLLNVDDKYDGFFITDFYDMIDNGHTVIRNKSYNAVSLNNWEEFYDFYLNKK